MKYAVSVQMLGYTRISGLVAYNNQTREFEEITTAVARKLIDAKEIKGLLWKNSEEFGTEFVCDTEGFNQQNICVKTSVGKYRPMLNDIQGIPINSMYTVVRKLLTDYRGTLYEVVSNKCARIKITEEQLMGLAEITYVAGVKITDTGVELCDGVQVEDRTEAGKKETVPVHIDSPIVKEEASQTGSETVSDGSGTMDVEAGVSLMEETPKEEKVETPKVETKASEESAEPKTLDEVFAGASNDAIENTEAVEAVTPDKKKPAVGSKARNSKTSRAGKK